MLEEVERCARRKGLPSGRRWVEAERFRSAKDAAKTPWRVKARGWRTFQEISVPTPVALTWLDQGTPWLVANVEDFTYSVDVSTAVRARGP